MVTPSSGLRACPHLLLGCRCPASHLCPACPVLIGRGPVCSQQFWPGLPKASRPSAPPDAFTPTRDRFSLWLAERGALDLATYRPAVPPGCAGAPLRILCKRIVWGAGKTVGLWSSLARGRDGVLRCGAVGQQRGRGGGLRLCLEVGLWEVVVLLWPPQVLTPATPSVGRGRRWPHF